MDKILIDAEKIYQWQRNNCSSCLLSIDYSFFETCNDSNYSCQIQKKIDRILISNCDDLIPVAAISDLFKYQKKSINDHCMNHPCPLFEYRKKHK